MLTSSKRVPCKEYLKFSIDNVELGTVTPPAGGFWELGKFGTINPPVENPWRFASKMAPFDEEVNSYNFKF